MSALDQPWNIGAALARGAAAHPDRDAIVAADIQLSYAKLWQIAQAFALNMQANGIGQGVTVALESPRSYRLGRGHGGDGTGRRALCVAKSDDRTGTGAAGRALQP